MTTSHPFETALDVRFRDLDAFGHVNNAVYATYCETARARFLREAVGETFSEPNQVVARLELDFEAPLAGADRVRVGVCVREVGESSVRLGYELRDDGRTVATGETVQVLVDPETGEPRPVPEAWRDALAGYRC
jgi:acyl-CoA thioester hydrolase